VSPYQSMKRQQIDVGSSMGGCRDSTTPGGQASSFTIHPCSVTRRTRLGIWPPGVGLVRIGHRAGEANCQQRTCSDGRHRRTDCRRTRVSVQARLEADARGSSGEAVYRGLRSWPIRSCRQAYGPRPPDPASTPSHLKRWVEMLELDPGIGRGEAPVDPLAGGVAGGDPGRDFLLDRRAVS